MAGLRHRDYPTTISVCAKVNSLFYSVFISHLATVADRLKESGYTNFRPARTRENQGFYSLLCEGFVCIAADFKSARNEVLIVLQIAPCKSRVVNLREMITMELQVLLRRW